MKQKNIELNDKILSASFNEAKAKLTAEYIKRCAVFLLEAKQNVGQDFSHRILELEADLESYQAKKPPINKIGFKQVNEENPAIVEMDNENTPTDLII